MLYESLVVFSILLIGFLLPQIVLSGFHFAQSARMLWLHMFLLLLAYFAWEAVLVATRTRRAPLRPGAASQEADADADEA